MVAPLVMLFEPRLEVSYTSLVSIVAWMDLKALGQRVMALHRMVSKGFLWVS